MQASGKLRIAGIGFIAGILYLFAIPVFWPAPTVDVYAPERISRGENANIQVVVSAWHPNFELQSAHALVDVAPERNSGTDVYHATLRAKPERKVWPFWSVNRFTRPRRQVFQLTLPVKELSEKGLLEEELTGTLTLVVEHVAPNDANRIPLGGYRPGRIMKQQPFRCKVSAS